jgi:hypothetical protein
MNTTIKDILLKLLLSLVFGCLLVNGFAQSDSSINRTHCLMIGLVFNPISIEKGYSSITSYSLQIGTKKSRVFPTFRFGFPKMTPNFKSSFQYTYSISGAYVQPGFTFYFNHPSMFKEVYYITVVGHFAKYRHRLTLDVNDKLWGTNAVYKYTNDEYQFGGLVEMGGMFAIYKALKMSSGLSVGVSSMPLAPLAQLNQYERKVGFMPGIGIGLGLGFGFKVGLHYEID